MLFNLLKVPNLFVGLQKIKLLLCVTIILRFYLNQSETTIFLTRTKEKEHNCSFY